MLQLLWLLPSALTICCQQAEVPHVEPHPRFSSNVTQSPARPYCHRHMLPLRLLLLLLLLRVLHVLLLDGCLTQGRVLLYAWYSMKQM